MYIKYRDFIDTADISERIKISSLGKLVCFRGFWPDSIVFPKLEPQQLSLLPLDLHSKPIHRVMQSALLWTALSSVNPVLPVTPMFSAKCGKFLYKN